MIPGAVCTPGVPDPLYDPPFHTHPPPLFHTHPPPPVPYPSTSPWRPMSCWVSSREMRPWNHGWVRWMAAGRGDGHQDGTPTHSGQGPPSWGCPCSCAPTLWALLTSTERGALAGGRQAVPVRRLLLAVQREQQSEHTPRGGPTPSPCPPTHPPGLRLLQHCCQHLAGVLNHPPRAPREVHGHQRAV